MFDGAMTWWRRLRSHYWAALAFDAVLLLAVILLLQECHSSRLAATESPPPERLLARLGDMSAPLPLPPENGKPTVLYFFAPWCGVCRHSIGNLDDLDPQQVNSLAVALSYASSRDVSRFVEETGLQSTVLLGDDEVLAAWGIRAFPTYYVLDESGDIADRSVGYSTSMGLRYRVWRAGW